MKHLFFLLSAITIFSCNSKHHLKPAEQSEVFGIFYKDTTQNLFADRLLKVRGEVSQPDSVNPEKNIIHLDSIFYYQSIDSAKKYKSKIGADSFATKMIAIPATWVKASTPIGYFKH